MSRATVLGGVQQGDKLLQLVDDPASMDDVLDAQHVRLEVTDGHMNLSLSQLRRFREAICAAERVLMARKEQAFLARNLPLPL